MPVASVTPASEGASEGRAGRQQLLPGWRAAAPLGVQDEVALSTAQSQTASFLLRGDGAGQPGEELDSLKPTDQNRGTEVQLLKPTTFYFHVTSSVKELQTL